MAACQASCQQQGGAGWQFQWSLLWTVNFCAYRDDFDAHTEFGGTKRFCKVLVDVGDNVAAGNPLAWHALIVRHAWVVDARGLRYVPVLGWH